MIRFFPIFFAILITCGCSAQRQGLQEVGYAKPKNRSPVKWAKVLPDPKKQMCPVVCLDAGHGGKDGGAAIKAQLLKEKILTLEVAQRVEKILKSRGISVLLTRSEDVYIPLVRRAELANQAACDVFVSIHFNSSSCAKTSGVEIFYFNHSKESARAVQSKLLGSCILAGLKDSIGTQSRGIKQANFCVVRETSMPSVLVEAAFLTNPKDAKLLSSVHYLQQIAEGIAAGIEQYLEKECLSKSQYIVKKTSSARIERATCRLGGDRSIH